MQFSNMLINELRHWREFRIEAISTEAHFFKNALIHVHSQTTSKRFCARIMTIEVFLFVFGGFLYFTYNKTCNKNNFS